VIKTPQSIFWENLVCGMEEKGGTNSAARGRDWRDARL
jgi:hypothetical protein